MKESPEVLGKFEAIILSGDEREARVFWNSLSEDRTAIEISEGFLSPILKSLGQRWHDGDIALSELYMSSKLCERLLMDMLPQEVGVGRRGCRIGICNLEDHHDLGRRMVYFVLRAGGYDVINYGRMEAEALAEEVVKDDLDVIMVSALMYRAALKVEVLKGLLEAKGSGAKVIVGGAPFNFDPGLWKTVRADAMGRDAASSLTLMEEMECRNR